MPLPKKSGLDPAKESDTILAKAMSVLHIEANSIIKLTERIDERFTKLVRLICNSDGRLIVSGIGKSGIIAKKIVATLNSTGTRSVFLHPVEAVHGDLGIVSRNDIFLALSNSGATEELNTLIPRIRQIGCPIIAFTGEIDSPLALQSDIAIDVGVDQEACPLGLAPTASTTAMLAMGDALAAVLIDQKQIKSEDFQKYHPGGNLGKRLSGRIADLMLTGARLPLVDAQMKMSEAIETIDKGKLGCALVTEADQQLAGIITDGDIRRGLIKYNYLKDMPVTAVMTPNPRHMPPQEPAYDALNLMEKHQITVLPITDQAGRILGILHLHDILGKGQFKFNASC
jgi:arabinose-5-phosphate isomerase